MEKVDLEFIRTLGRIYRDIINLCPECMPKGHEHKAAQQPFIWINRAMEKVGAQATIPEALNERMHIMALMAPTMAVNDALYEYEQSAFLLGYHDHAPRPGTVRTIPFMRQLRGMTQAELAEASGVSRATISRLESLDPDQKRAPQAGTLKLIAKALQCSISDLL